MIVMKFEISGKMHMYLEVNEEMTEKEVEEKFYSILNKLVEENEYLSFTIHESEQYEL